MCECIRLLLDGWNVQQHVGTWNKGKMHGGLRCSIIPDDTTWSENKLVYYIISSSSSRYHSYSHNLMAEWFFFIRLITGTIENGKGALYLIGLYLCVYYKLQEAMAQWFLTKVHVQQLFNKRCSLSGSNWCSWMCSLLSREKIRTKIFTPAAEHLTRLLLLMYTIPTAG